MRVPSGFIHCADPAETRIEELDFLGTVNLISVTRVMFKKDFSKFRSVDLSKSLGMFSDIIDKYTVFHRLSLYTFFVKV